MKRIRIAERARDIWGARMISKSKELYDENCCEVLEERIKARFRMLQCNSDKLREKYHSKRKPVKQNNNIWTTTARKMKECGQGWATRQFCREVINEDLIRAREEVAQRWTDT